MLGILVARIKNMAFLWTGLQHIETALEGWVNANHQPPPWDPSFVEN